MSEEAAQAEATEFAADVLSLTQGDYSALNAPDYFNTRLGKMAFLFRKFQAIPLRFFTEMAKRSFAKGLTQEERAMARAQLGYALATHFMMAGVKGLPAMSAIAALLSMVGMGDDDEEWEDTMRRWATETGTPVWMQDFV